MEQEQIYDRLKTFSTFSKWPQEDLQRLSQLVIDEPYKANEDIFRAEDIEDLTDDAYIVDKGRVKQTMAAPNGARWHFRTLGEGEMFGQQALFRGRQYATTATAETDCRVLRIPPSALTWLLTRYPDLWTKFIEPDISARLRGISLLRSMNDPQIEQLAKTATIRKFEKGQRICQVMEPDGWLWIVDWGQVEVREHSRVQLTDDGRFAVGPPTAFQSPPEDDKLEAAPRLTAGHWFLSGDLHIPGLQTVTAYAATRVEMVQIPATVLRSLLETFEDVDRQLRAPLPVVAWLRGYLQQDEYFRNLKDSHWRHLAGFAMREHIPANLTASKQGEKDRKVRLLVSGAARIKARDEEGREHPQQVVGPGFFYGVESMLKGTPKDATVRAYEEILPGQQTSGADWLVLSRDDLAYMVREKPLLWRGTKLRSQFTKQPRKQFDWLDDEEEVVLKTRRHPISLVPIFLLPLGLWILIAVGLALFLPSLALPTVFLILAVLMLIMVPIPLINHFLDYYAVTNRRVTRLERTIFLHEDRVEAPLERIQDTTLETNLFGLIFGYGDLRISTAATIGTIDFPMIPDPETVQGTLHAKRREVQAGRKEEQRETMRTELLRRFNLHMIPKLRDQALPPGTRPSPRNPWERLGRTLESLWNRWVGWWRNLWEGFVNLLMNLLPRSSRERVQKRRTTKKKQEQGKDPEVVVYRKHWIILLRITWWSLLLFIGYLVLLFLGWRYLLGSPPLLQIPGPILAVSGFFILVTFFIFWFKYENWRNDQYILTASHLIDYTALPLGLRERKRQAEWDKVQNATYVLPTFWANLFDYGSVFIQTAAAEGLFEFVWVPHPRHVQQEIFRRLERHRLQRDYDEAMTRQRMFSETLKLHDELLQEEGINNPSAPRPRPRGSGTT